jgi:hypothetical protein
MADAFDPYYVWLGIPPEEQPADHYRLLGLRRFETSAAVIDNAADRAMGHLRTVATGKHGAEAQRLLNELSAARVCLLSPDARASYDAELRFKFAPRMRFTPPPVPEPAANPRPIAQPPLQLPSRATMSTGAPAIAPAPATVTSPSVTSLTYRRNARPTWIAPLLTFVFVVAFGLISYLVWQDRNDARDLVADSKSSPDDGDDRARNDKPNPPRPGTSLPPNVKSDGSKSPSPPINPPRVDRQSPPLVDGRSPANPDDPAAALGPPGVGLCRGPERE